MTGTAQSEVIALLVGALVLVVAAPLRPRPRRSPAASPRPEADVAVDRDRAATRFTTVARRALSAIGRSHGYPQPRAVAAWCDDLARELRSGSTLRHALAVVGPDDDTTRTCTDPLRLAVERSRPIGAAVATIHRPGPHLGIALAVVDAAAEVGGSAAEPLDRVAGALRQRAADQDERVVQAAQARLSAHVMTAVPLLMLTLLTMSDDDVRDVLGSPVGVASVGIGLTLNALGWCWMRRIVGSASVGSAGSGQRRSPLSRRRTRREIEHTWPDAVESLVHAVGAGLTPRQAVEQLATSGPAPVRDAFAGVVHRTARGQALADALRALTDALGPRAAGVADAIGTSDRYGLPLAPVLDQLARDAREARRRLDQAAARRLPVRLSFPLVTCTLPSFVLLAIAPAVIAALSSLGGTAW